MIARYLALVAFVTGICISIWPVILRFSSVTRPAAVEHIKRIAFVIIAPEKLELLGGFKLYGFHFPGFWLVVGLAIKFQHFISTDTCKTLFSRRRNSFFRVKLAL
jgi:hypothetical protein